MFKICLWVPYTNTFDRIEAFLLRLITCLRNWICLIYNYVRNCVKSSDFSLWIHLHFFIYFTATRVPIHGLTLYPEVITGDYAWFGRYIYSTIYYMLLINQYRQKLLYFFARFMRVSSIKK